jgi:hypothetical protein
LLSSIAITTAVKKGHLALSLEENSENEKHNATSDKSPDSTASELIENHRKAMQDCVRMIDWTLDDFMTGIHSPHNDLCGSSVSCSFTMIKNSIVDFMALSHSLVRTELIARSTRLACRLRRIDLPVSGDGTHCSISLEASYEMFPFTVHSYHGKFLSSDLDDLSLMHLEVVQSIPLPMIDASLLFGIPLVVRAGLETDYAQFQEMKMLVRSFFTVLQKQERAILLRGTSQCRWDKHTNTKYSKENLHDGFSYPPEQYFLLMPQETPTNMINAEIGSAGPNSGLLFRIAHSDYLLHDKYVMDSTPELYLPTDDDRETEIQYMEYIENSLSTLDVGMYNPFTIYLPNNEQSNRPTIFENAGSDGDMQTSTNVFGEEQSPLPIQDPTSISGDASIDDVLNEMDISYEAAKLSIYDLHAVPDDMSD